MIGTQVIPDIFAEVVARVNAATSTRATDPFTTYFDFGSYNEVRKKLVFKDQSVTMKDTKYPLVWLVQPFSEKLRPQLSVYASIQPRIFIIDQTDPNATTQERYGANGRFTLRLYPIFDELLKQISLTPAFYQIPIAKMQFTKTDYPYWGLDGEEADTNLFTDFVDAIELKNFALNVNTKKLC